MLWKIICFIVWILMIAFVVNRAGQLNRSKLGWGIFAVFLPVIAFIVILFMGPKR